MTEEWVFHAQVPDPVPVTPGTGTGGDRPVDPYACLEAVATLEEQAQTLFDTADNLNNAAEREETRAENLAETLDNMDPYEELAEAAQQNYEDCVDVGCYNFPGCIEDCGEFSNLAAQYTYWSNHVKSTVRYQRLEAQMNAAALAAENLREQAEEITEQAEQKQAEADQLRASC